MAASALALLWTGEVVEGDDVAGRQRRGKLSLDRGLEDEPVHRPIHHEGRDRTGASEPGESLGLLVSERCFRAQPLTFQASTAKAGHLRRRAGLVEEDELIRLKPQIRLLGHPVSTMVQLTASIAHEALNINTLFNLAAMKIGPPLRFLVVNGPRREKHGGHHHGRFQGVRIRKRV